MYVKFENGAKYTAKKTDNQELSDSLDDFEDAGYILEDSDLVVDIDCLDRNQIIALIDTFKIQTETVWTERGVHFYYKKPRGFNRKEGTTPLGFKAEFKHKNNTYAITVKHNGHERAVDYRGVRKPFPKYFEPLRNATELLGLDEGSGRNDALYQHKRRIAKYGNTHKILRFINDHIFDTPLDDDEFESVARDEAITAEKDGENIIADLIMKENKVILHKGTLFFRDNGTYINDENKLIRLVYDYCPGQKTRYVDEVIKQMKYRCEVKNDDDEYKIKLKNGYLFHGKFYPYEYTDFTPYYIDINYFPDAKEIPVVDEYLDQLSDGDEDYKQFILEIIGSTLITDSLFKRNLAKFFIFVGDGGNGKGTLLQVITRILGEKNVAANSISELCDERYLNTLVGKLANLGDDIQDEPINKRQMKTLKNLSTGDTIQVRRLYENPTTVRLSPTLIFTSNHMIKTFDKDYSYKRRVAWCPMYKKPKVMTADFITQLTTKEALEYWMKLIVDAYQRLYKEGKFTEPAKIAKFNREYHKDNDSTLEYLEDMDDEDIIWKKPKDLYEDYKTWCDENGIQAQKAKQLRASIEARGFKVAISKKRMPDGRHNYRVWQKRKDHFGALDPTQTEDMENKNDE